MKTRLAALLDAVPFWLWKWYPNRVKAFIWLNAPLLPGEKELLEAYRDAWDREL